MESLALCGSNNFDDAFEASTPLALYEQGTARRNSALANEILGIFLEHRRVPNAQEACQPTCPACRAPHLTKIEAAVGVGEAITLVLPAFPGKSPNQAKVLGPLPDMAEKLALQFLDRLCRRVEAIYAPGAHIILCSDGRVFSDIVGMREEDVTAYQRELNKMIEKLQTKNISAFNLDELSGGDFRAMRLQLMEEFGAPLATLQEKVRSGAFPGARAEDKEANRMYCGITRFLAEDSSFPEQTKSRTAVQKECKAKAYEVIRRSNAWSELIAARYPRAVRLSIHPQGCGAKKLGLCLVGRESWMTPWHGVAVKVGGEFVLLKRAEAEALGAELKCENGRASHFEWNEAHAESTIFPGAQQ